MARRAHRRRGGPSSAHRKRTLIDLPRLQKLADQFQSAWQDFAKDLDTAPTASERAKIDLEFHHQLVLTTENEYLIDMFETLRAPFTILSIRSCEFVATEQKKDNLIVMGSQHVAICSAIGLGLPELARSAMERHIDFCCSRCLITAPFTPPSRDGGTESASALPGALSL